VRGFLAALALLALAMPDRVRAHQLDEYLQAARIAFARAGVELQVDLTPGVAVAGEIVAGLDRDGDGLVRPAEARAYGDAAIDCLELTLDGHVVRLALTHIEVPPVADMRRGLGTIQLTAAGTFDDVGRGSHHVRFANRHHPATSVYLANALVPADHGVRVVAQRRDERQQQLEIEYAVASQWPVQLIWLIAGALVTSRVLLRVRTRHVRSL
jgi:hypothetical protein